MVCTFGDATDVRVVARAAASPLRQIVGRDGRLAAGRVRERRASRAATPAAANRVYAELAGKTVDQARASAIVELLREPAGSATGSGAPLRGEPEPIEHAVKFYEKGDRPLEFVPTRQWFVRLLDKKDDAAREGRARSQWHPRLHGQALPRLDREPQPRLVRQPPALLRRADPGLVSARRERRARLRRARSCAERDQLPGRPDDGRCRRGYDEAPARAAGRLRRRDRRLRHLVHELADAADRLALGRSTRSATRRSSRPTCARRATTSSAPGPSTRSRRRCCTRTSVPWHHVAISGFDPRPRPQEDVEEQGQRGDAACRCSSSTAPTRPLLGRRARGSASTPPSTRRSSRSASGSSPSSSTPASSCSRRAAEVRPIAGELDRAFAARAARARRARDRAASTSFEHAHALQETETFFWTRFTDTYLELAKVRARGERRRRGRARLGGGDAAPRPRVLLRLFAPFLPYITEEVWSWAFAAETGQPSIHRAPWPGERGLRRRPGARRRRELRARDRAARRDQQGEGRRARCRWGARSSGSTLAGEAGDPRAARARARRRARGRALRRPPPRSPRDLEPGAFVVVGAKFAERGDGAK